MSSAAAGAAEAVLVEPNQPRDGLEAGRLVLGLASRKDSTCSSQTRSGAQVGHYSKGFCDSACRFQS